ncbi:MAG: nuclear transport factor 2 family protein [Bacteroidetes bacterium]|nr:nuclear transport factor 2 family protein [Bacteroidota bacterium]
MTNNPQTVAAFYTAFQQTDAAAMNNCYSEDISFFDPAFGMLHGDEVRCMWEMLCKNARDFSLTYGNIVELDDEYCTCDWEAHYTFSKTGKKVINKVKANMKLANGKIVEHSDAFSLHRWSAQAMGFTGWLLGSTKFFQNKVRNTARRSLLQYMQGKQ